MQAAQILEVPNVKPLWKEATHSPNKESAHVTLVESSAATRGGLFTSGASRNWEEFNTLRAQLQSSNGVGCLLIEGAARSVSSAQYSQAQVNEFKKVFPKFSTEGISLSTNDEQKVYLEKHTPLDLLFLSKLITEMRPADLYNGKLKDDVKFDAARYDNSVSERVFNAYNVVSASKDYMTGLIWKKYVPEFLLEINLQDAANQFKGRGVVVLLSNEHRNFPKILADDSNLGSDVYRFTAPRTFSEQLPSPRNADNWREEAKVNLRELKIFFNK
jgi:hypothetical protein